MNGRAPATIYLDLTAAIVAAHVGNNATPADALPNLIEAVYRALAGAAVSPAIAKPDLKPAVPIKNSVLPDYIICLEDGKKLKLLKRHLQTAYGMTPDAYRQKWQLPGSYPMVAPNYASRRSELAKAIGLGQRSAVEQTEPTVTRLRARRAKGSRG